MSKKLPSRRSLQPYLYLRVPECREANGSGQSSGYHMSDESENHKTSRSSRCVSGNQTVKRVLLEYDRFEQPRRDMMDEFDGVGVQVKERGTLIESSVISFVSGFMANTGLLGNLNQWILWP
ncbi:uncharacterized protein N7529_012094 [Penicillium soppii]|uniref:uncharacterized protein n=1 Tax=Penicillium soppii TaxID=69789 RepID=UPI0025474365|nr:uncharacterized protein N7529_012094 [Penicillium soppii]KAJ5852709.1 hypothetical protein N7529_012094 [Penicillium soppii]